MSTYTRLKASCVLCHSEMATNMISRHHGTKQCLSGGKFTDSGIAKQCKHCGLTYSDLTPSEKNSHGKTCVKNPRNAKVVSAERVKNGGYKHSPETIEKIKSKLAQALLDGKMTTRKELARIGRANANYKASEETKAKISKSMREVAKNNPEKYSGGKYNRGHVKQKICSNGMTVIGGWEELFVEFCVRIGAKVTQPTESFTYYWEGERSYYPDFYLPEYDYYVEVKGLKTERDDSKWNTITAIHGKSLMVVDSKAINKINNISNMENLIKETKFK